MDFEVMHITVEGSLKNPYVAFAVAVLAITIAAVVRGAVFSVRQGRWTRALLLLAVAAILTASTPFAQLRLAWLSQTVAIQRRVAVTYANPPAMWIAPALGVALGLAKCRDRDASRAFSEPLRSGGCAASPRRRAHEWAHGCGWNHGGGHGVPETVTGEK